MKESRLRQLVRRIFGGDAPAAGRAHLRVIHRRPMDFDEKRGLWVFGQPDPEERVSAPFSLRAMIEEIIDGVHFGRLGEAEGWNLITNAGRIFVHTQAYGTSGLGANGLNYIALSNDAVTETATSTVLSNEIVANGLARAQATVTLPVGSGNRTTLDKTFTCVTAAQSAQKAAAFSAPAAGTMNHVIGFAQRALQVNDTLQTTYNIDLG